MHNTCTCTSFINGNDDIHVHVHIHSTDTCTCMCASCIVYDYDYDNYVIINYSFSILLFYREVNGHLDNELERRQNSHRLRGRYVDIRTAIPLIILLLPLLLC